MADPRTRFGVCAGIEQQPREIGISSEKIARRADRIEAVQIEDDPAEPLAPAVPPEPKALAGE